MRVDLTLRLTPKLAEHAKNNEKRILAGHLGTHFDVMDRTFPLDYLERWAIVFDVRAAKDREIGLEDIDLSLVEAGMFVAFYTGYLEAVGYGGDAYFAEHPQLSQALLSALVGKGVSIIGIDFAGVRRGGEHSAADRFCADRGCFVVENLCGLDQVLENGEYAYFTAHTYPMNYAGMTGLPCRVVAAL